MIASRLTVRLRPMRLGDIPEVVEIDRLVFPTPWPARSYRYELVESRNSSMFVLSLPESEPPGNGRLASLVSRLRFGEPAAERIIGYSGFWFITDEAHISTIGMRPEWQGRKLGELLLFAMLRESLRMGARQTTLEVRISNRVAQNLYHKYGFEVVGRRKGYYRDNREDAWMMAVRSGQQAYAGRLAELGAVLFDGFDVIDEWL